LKWFALNSSVTKPIVRKGGETTWQKEGDKVQTKGKEKRQGNFSASKTRKGKKKGETKHGGR